MEGALVQITQLHDYLLNRFFAVERLDLFPIRQHAMGQHAVNDPSFAFVKIYFGSINVPEQVIAKFRVKYSWLHNECFKSLSLICWQK